MTRGRMQRLAASGAGLLAAVTLAGCGTDEPTGSATVSHRYEGDAAPVLSVGDSGGEAAVWFACTPDCVEVGRGRELRPDPARPARFEVELDGERTAAGRWLGRLVQVGAPDLHGTVAVGKTVIVDPVARWRGGWAGDREIRAVEACASKTTATCHPVSTVGAAELAELSGMRWVRAVDVRRPPSQPLTLEAYPPGKGPSLAVGSWAAVGPFHRLAH